MRNCLPISYPTCDMTHCIFYQLVQKLPINFISSYQERKYWVHKASILQLSLVCIYLYISAASLLHFSLRDALKGSAPSEKNIPHLCLSLSISIRDKSNLSFSLFRQRCYFLQLSCSLGHLPTLLSSSVYAI